KEAPDFLPAWLLLADLSSGKKNYDESQRYLNNIFNRDPDNVDAHIFQARIRLAKGETDKAIQGLEHLDSRLPNFGPVKVELARCHVQKNNVTQAIAVLDQALTANPENLEAVLLLGRINLGTGKQQATVDSMKALLEKHPDLGAAKLLLADAYRALGQLEEAAAIFRDQLQATPNNAEAHLALGIILRQQKKEGEAREMFEKAQRLAPANPMPLLQLVDMALVSRDFPKAEQLVRDQMQKTPNVALIHLLQGRVYSAQAKWTEAETALNEATKLNPNLVEPYALLATVYTASNKLPEAIRQLEAVVERAPKDTRALMSLAVLYEKTGNFEKARDNYEKLIAITPDFAAALNNLAFLYVERFNDLDRAYQLAQKARSLQPGDASIADTLGWVLFKKRDYQQALPLLTEAADKAPNQPEISYHVGMCHYMMGAIEPARTALERALKSAAEFPQKADAERRLALLSKDSSKTPFTQQELESLARQQPDDVLTHIRLAESYEAANAFPQAAAQYEAALKLSSKLPATLIKLANIYAGPLNDPAKALEYAKTARELSPGDAQTTLLVGRIAFKTGNYAWAYGLLKQSSDQLEADAEAHHSLGWSAFTMGKIPEATREMEKVLKLAPDTAIAEDAKLWLELMRLADARNIKPESAGKVAEVLNKDPNYAPAQVAQAAIAAAGGNVDGAISQYERLLGRFPDYAPAQKELAKLYATRPADLQKGYDIATKARKNLPEDNELTRILADISYQRKEYGRALELLNESARREPLDAKQLYYKGICSWQTKDTAQAREALTQALDNGLQEPLAADARRALQNIGQN
ncbi:MAG TPA: tetratricopeptide repeat protein, partial [Chthoniobacterales bacterium]|nr:tetratricopeptide repeat protein [Chthoniobacterales bacterium]